MSTSIAKAKKSYSHLSEVERGIIAILYYMKHSIRSIAKELGRSPSTISREITHNGGARVYDEKKANSKAKKRWKKSHPFQRLTTMQRALVEMYLCQYYSPEQISHTIKTAHPAHTISHESIYLYIYKEAPHLAAYLRKHRSTRKKRGNSYKSRGIGIPNRVPIHERGDISHEYGHWEADLVGSSSKSTILTIVARKTKHAYFIKVANKKAITIIFALIHLFVKIPPSMRKSITFDNGKENVLHYVLSILFDMNTYFCDPYSAWQKGLVENTIGLLRQFFPKKTNFNDISESDILNAETLINSRPRKILGFITPEKLYSVALAS